ncbi:unnamed protein product [Fasciola hepatica]|uniref:Reverse transcriptase domain-containing protein n=1 Tax=Fasciola hepatica TaxID=6192 RepID=A0ABC9HGK8_FASHE|nr:unnamed protein product [Fasciola hepatica]
MASFDFQSLFTNVPGREVIRIMCDHVEQNELKIGIPVSVLVRQLLLCTTNVSFSFLGWAYRQIDGVAIRTPLSPILAHMFLAHLEEKASKILERSQLYKRYVDHVLVITISLEETTWIMDKLDRLHPNIRFTMETEIEDTLHFLDIKITRNNDGTMARSVYRKETWTGQCLQFDSFVSVEYERGLVRTLFQTARHICTEDMIDNELRQLKESLTRNAYPDAFIEKHSKPKLIRQTNCSAEKLLVTICLPFIRDDINCLLKRPLGSALAQNKYYAPDLRIIHRTIEIPTPSVKQRPPLYTKSNLIYQFQCSCGATYVGRTERQLRNRVIEYIPNWVQRFVMQSGSDQRHNDNVRNHKIPSSAVGRRPSAVARPLLMTQHPADRTTAFRVIYVAKNTRLLRQIDGVAIRTPLSPILAHMFLAHLEEKASKILERSQLYKRYVDHVLVITISLKETTWIMDKLDRLHPNIRFTMETEIEDTLHFLDIKITRNNDGTMARSVYRKETWTGQCLQFDSFVSVEYERGLVRTLFQTARHICTDDMIDNELRQLKESLTRNAYPDAFIEKHSKPKLIRQTNCSAEKLLVTICLPFIRDDINCLLKRPLGSALAQNKYYAPDLRIIHRTIEIPTPSVKQRPPLYTKSNLIYQFQCSCGATYVGRTERQLRNRVIEYIPNWVQRFVMQSGSAQRHNDNVRNHKIPSSAVGRRPSAVARHLLMTQHPADRSTAFRVIYVAKNTRLLSFVSVEYERGLVRTLFQTARHICTEDMIDNKLRQLKESLTRNAYPDAFIEKHSKPKLIRQTNCSAEKLLVTICLPFIRDDINCLLKRPLGSALAQNKYYAPDLRIIHRTIEIPTPSVKQRPPMYTKSNLIYQFQCSCEATYVGRTERQLRNRVIEYIPNWVQRFVMQSGSDQRHNDNVRKHKIPSSAVGRRPSAVARPLLMTQHPADRTTAFRVIYVAKNTRLLSFVSVEYERGLVRTLFQTARHICTEDMIDNKLRQLKESLTRNAYPDAFIEKHSKPKLIRQTNCSAEKLLVTICLPFIRDDINCLLKRPLGSALAQNKYYAPDLRIIHRTIEIPTPSVKQRPPMYTKSNLIYQFQCSCEATYVGRTERQLRNRVIEYIPNWVQRFVMQSGSDQRHNDNVRKHKIPSSAVGRRPSAVARPLLMTQHPADRSTAFRVIYVAKNTRLLRQIDGVAIRTPLSPILAHMFLAHLEEKASKILERSQLYKRYVDHVLVITISLEETTWIMDKLDRLHPNIRFTMETEIEDTLHFLDIKITRNNDGTMARSVYRKETWTGRCLQFDSFVSVEYERGLVRTLFQTARHICTEDMIDNELRQLKESLTRNAYPDAFIEKHSKPKLIRQTNCSAEKLLVTICLPFIRDDINCLLKRPLGSALAKNKYYAPDLRIIHRTIEIPTPSVKQRPPMYTKSNLIYQFQCSCEATYVGRTERQLRNRVIEYIPNWVQRFVMQSGSDQRHNDNVRKHKIPSSAVGRRPSAVARHLLMTQHPADRTTAFRVIYVAKNTRLLRQIDGVAIRTPLSPILAHMFLAHLEEKASKILERSQLYKRYLDHVLVITISLEETTWIMDKLDRLHPNIRFTMETEIEDTLHFLDIKMTRNNDGTMARSVYRKETWTGQCLQFDSFVSVEYERGLVRTLFQTARHICTEDMIDNELRQLKESLTRNAYPDAFIEKHSKPKLIRQTNCSAEKLLVTLCLPFIRDDINCLLKRPLGSALAQNKYYAPDLRIIHRTIEIPTPSVKQRPPLYTKSNLIYQFQCSCGATYVGRTERQLRNRVIEYIPNWVQRFVMQSGSDQRHNGNVRKHKIPSSAVGRRPSAVARHLLMTQHPADRTTAFRVIYVEKNTRLLRQIDGVAIRTPLSPILAHMFLAHLEEKASKILERSQLYKRYVDHVLVILISLEETTWIMDKLDRLHPNIRFTMETEIEDTLHFLDIKITRNNDGTMARSVYRKETWTGQCLQFDSFVSVEYERGLVRTLFQTARHICTEDMIDNELRQLKESLTRNAYPDAFIEKHSKPKLIRQTNCSAEKLLVTLCLPFIRDDINCLLKRPLGSALAQNKYYAPDLRIIHRTIEIPTPSVKQRPPMYTKSNLIYQFQCSCGATYVGRTERQLRNRVIEYIPNWVQRFVMQSGSDQRHNDNVRNHKIPSSAVGRRPSAVARPLLMTQHPADRSTAFRVIYVAKNTRLLRQIDGVAIRTPLSPILAHMFLAHLEEKASKILERSQLYKRYVDHVLVITISLEETTWIMDKLDRLHPNIRFTMETEIEDTLHFLDIKMTRKNDGTMARSVYRKETWTGQCLQFDSFVSVEYERGLVRTLFQTARHICTEDMIDNELRQLKESLTRNAYPDAFIEKHSKPKLIRQTDCSAEKLLVTICLPFIRDDINCLLKRPLGSALAQNKYYAPDLRIIHRTIEIPTPSVKQRPPMYTKSNLIYQFQCSCGATYVGRTERQLRNRVIEYIPNWVQRFVMQSGSDQRHNDNVRNHKIPSSAVGRRPSAVARHLLMTQHPADRTTAFRVIYVAKNTRLLRQIDGVAIRTPLSPILAHMFLAHLEEKASKILERSQLYKRYVDHVLVITISLEETTWIMDKLDRLHPNIRFTMETEIEDTLHFLDIKMTRNNDGTMARSVYRKETWTGQCLQFDSFVSVEYERGLVRTLFQTARHICTEDMIDNELRQLKESLTRNAYPDAFIEKHSKPKLIRQTNCSAEKLLVTLCLPFIRDDINCLLKRPLGSALAKNKYYAPDLRIIHRTIEIPTPSVKQRPPLYTKSNLIYQFQCSCGATYLGRTERQLRNRVIEYIPNWVQRFVMQSGSDQRHNDNVRNHKIPSSAVGRRPSAVARHLLMTQHPADRTTAFRVIYVAKNTRLLRQIDGVAIRTPLSPILAHMFLAHLEEKASKILERSQLYKRYVDHVLVITISLEETTWIMDKLDRLHPNIRFTMETEIEDTLHFLDIKITRNNDGTMARSVYRKETWTGQCLQFDSFVSVEYERGLVRTLFQTARHICTDDMIDNELRQLKESFTRNAYPDAFIEKHSKPKLIRQTNCSAEKLLVTICLPFIRDDINCLLKRPLGSALAQNKYYAPDLRIIHRTIEIPTPSVKQRPPLYTKSNLIYQFQCSCGATYVGRTERQ